MKESKLRGIIGVVTIFIFLSAAEIVQRYRHPFVGFRGMYNSLGFRGREFKVEKRPGEVRIIFIGSSTTFGVGNSLENTFPFLVEEILNKKLGPDQVEVINAALPGKNSSWELNRIKETLYLKTDVIIVMSGYNDAASIYSNYVKFDKDGSLIIRMPWYLKVNGFLTRHSVFYVTLREKIAILRFGNPQFAFINPISFAANPKPQAISDWFRHYPQFYRKNLETMINVAKAHNIKIIFLSPPLSNLRREEFQLYAEALLQLKNQLLYLKDSFNVPVINLDSSFSWGEKSWENFSSDGLHFTEAGNLKIAEAISDFLLQNKANYL